MQRKILRLILGDQLNGKHSWFRDVDADVTYLMLEIRSETDYVQHHIQKVSCIFAAMRQFATMLRAQGHRVIYGKLDDANAPRNFNEAIRHYVNAQKFTGFEYQEPDEFRLDNELGALKAELAGKCHVVMCSSEHFLTSRNELQAFFGPKHKMRLMERFYRHMRVKHRILMDGDAPVGAAWNFDADNRKKFRGQVPIPPTPSFANDLSEICAMLEAERVETIGNITADALDWPVNREQAQMLLEHFCAFLLPHFGRFQDAMTVESPWLFHSRLSFALNIKLLHPREVIDAAVRAWEAATESIDIAQIEGFVRQILGWREYMRGIYWERMPAMADMNFFEHTRALPQMYWSGKTTMRCMQHSIEQSLDEAYAHHIQRLMITGNFALLAGIDPAAVDAWYLGIYLDAFEWVEMPNTRGMSQYADGGVVASKPYIASANYIHKMSDYCANCAYDRTQKTGKSSCPFNSLYWAFLERHRNKLGKHQRMRMMYRVWDKMDTEQRTQVLKRAQDVLENLDEL